MKTTIKEKLLLVRDFILTRGKIVFPILLIAAVAVTVTIALQAKANNVEEAGVPETAATNVSVGDDGSVTVPDAPLELNAYPDVNSLIQSYYEATANGDVDTIASIQSSVEDMERIRIQELGKYIENYPLIEVYTKPGPEDGSYIVIASTQVSMSYYPDDYLPGYATFYVCTREDGSLYINQETVSEEISEYIRKVILQDDVVELCNKITVEYKEICIAKPELFNYISEVEQEVKTAAGVILAQQNAEAEGTVSGGDTVSNPDAGNETGEAGTETPVEEAGPIYATATTTVNVRSSDSETADKLGKLTNGTRIEVLEQKVNGWSKILFEGKEGYVKSEYLSVVESANDVETIGTVTATANVNIRAAASETAERIGVVAGGEQLSLVANEGDWCKVVYNGQIGYVKAEYVE